MKTPHTRHVGFTLIETAIALLIVGLVLGGGLSALSRQLEQQKSADTRWQLELAQQALLGYAASQTPPHLPCPDKTAAAGDGVAGDGLEDVSAATGICVSPEGHLPWVTLGLADVDAWGQHLHYRVTPEFSNRAPAPTLGLASGATLRVCQTNACAVVVANLVPVVILSYGANGWGGVNSAGVALPAPTSADELANTDADTVFVSRSPSAAGAPAGEFDDLVRWIPSGILFNRLIQAGKLP